MEHTMKRASIHAQSAKRAVEVNKKEFGIVGGVLGVLVLIFAVWYGRKQEVKSGNRQTCAELVCPAPYLPRAEASSVACTDELCNWDVDRDICCERRESCNPWFTCPNHMYLKPGTAFCNETKCENSEQNVNLCCNTRSTCSEFSCAGSYASMLKQQLIERADETYCTSSPCNQFDDFNTCCDEEPCGWIWWIVTLVPRIIYTTIYNVIKWPLVLLKGICWMIYVVASFLAWCLWTFLYYMVYRLPAFLFVYAMTILYYLLLIMFTLCLATFAYSLWLAAEGATFDLKLGAQGLLESFIDACPRTLFTLIAKVYRVRTGEVTPEVLAAIQVLFTQTFQERSVPGSFNPSQLTVKSARWVQHPVVYKEYVKKRQEICYFTSSGDETHKVQTEDILSDHADTSFICMLGWGRMISSLNKTVNEALMFHATSPSSAEKILMSRVIVTDTDAANGELYGVGTYFAESPSKADTYARPDENGEFSMIINRVILGNIITTEEPKPDISKLTRKIKAKFYNTICGDRRQIQHFYGGWREFITVDKEQSMPLLLVKYKRADN